jgi:hypothetical protein
MIHSRTLRIFFVFIMVLFFTFFCNALTGCSRKPAKSPSKNQGSEKKESQALIRLQTDIESVLKEYEKVYLAQTAPPPQSPQQSQESNKQEQQQSDSKNSGQSEKGEKGGQEGDSEKQQSSGGGQTEKKADWPKLEQDIAKIHEQWNNFQSEAIKSGASLEMIDDFSNTLNHLTMTITRQELYEGLITITNLYDKTIDIEKLFKTKTPPDIKKILYYGRLATYNILNNDEIGAKESINNAFTAWYTVKPQVEDTTKSSNAEFSLRELEQAIMEKDPNLIKIKAQICEKKIRDLMESMEK